MLRYLQAQPDNLTDAKRMSAAYGVPLILARALLQRGIVAEDDVRAFLHPSAAQLHDPFLLNDVDAAIACIRRHMAASHRIAIYGDYDADGICATAMLLEFLRAEGADALPYLPSRHNEGYGMHANAIHLLHEEGVRLIITVDNGVSAFDEVALCYELGMEIIITDHHQCPPQLPVCEAVINPHRADSTYPYPNLCGAGVVLKLIQAMGGGTEPYLALAALATVADVVELRGENRVITALGLPHVLRHIGLKALLEVSGSTGSPITSAVLAFRIAPRLNGVGRIGEPGKALELLLAKEYTEAHTLALQLNDANATRQKEEQAILRQARNMLRREDTVRLRAILLYAEGWNAGIIGIVAARLREEFHRPVLLFSLKDGLLTGSCRSIPGVNLYDCLAAHANYFIRFGGHAQAAGITMAYEQFGVFKQDFLTYLRNELPQQLFIPTQEYEQELQLSSLIAEDIELMRALEPFGAGNTEPVFRASGVSLSGVERMGGDGAHARATVAQGKARFQLVAFSYGERAEELRKMRQADLLFTAGIQEWQGNRRLQLQLRAARHVSPLLDADCMEALRQNFYDAFFDNFLYNETQNSAGTASLHFVKDMDAAVAECLHADLSGTIVLCHTPAGALRLRNLLQTASLADCVDVHVGVLPRNERGAYNTVLLAPNRRLLELGAFETVIAYDGLVPGGQTITSQEEQAPLALVLQKGQVLLVPELPVEHGMLAPLRLGRERMGELYQAMLRGFKNAPQKREHLLEACTRFGYETATLAILIFIELGLFLYDAKSDILTAVNNSSRKSLTQSYLYCLANPNA